MRPTSSTPFDLPTSAARLVVALVVLGFPLALVLAWAYEVRPEEPRVEEAPGADHPHLAGPRPSPVVMPPPRSDDPRPSLAVLPFASFSEGPETDYFGLGVMEDVLTRLAHVKGIRLCSRTSVMRYKAAETCTRDIARELGVRAILEGSVRRANGRVRVVAQLIDGVTDEHLWAETYDREVEDVFNVQTEVAEAIAAALKAELTPEERAGVRRIPTESLQAWELYVRAAQRIQELLPSGIAEAEAMLLKAIGLDPDFAQAWAALALARVLAVLCANERPSELWPKTREAASRAMELNPRCAEAHTAMGVLKTYYEWDPKGAEQEFERVRRLDPDGALALGWEALFLAFMGRSTEALTIARKGVALEPLSALAHLSLGQVLVLGDDFDEAAHVLEAAAGVWPHHPHVHMWLGVAYGYNGDWERALTHFEAGIEFSGRLPHFVALEGVALAHLGRLDEARAILGGLAARSEHEYVDPFLGFFLTLPVDGVDAAAPYLERMLEVRSFFVPYLRLRRFRPLRADPRFRAAMDKALPGAVFEGADP